MKYGIVVVKYVIVLLLLGTVFSQALAAQCSAVFPGPKTFAAKGGVAIGNNNGNACNGGSCAPVADFELVTPFPSISPTGTFNSNTISDGVYQRSTWGLPQNAVVTFSGAGTAVIYFSQSTIINQNTRFNLSGTAANAMIIVNGSLTIRQNSQLNAFIYATGSISVDQNVVISGAVSAGGALSIGQNGSFTYNATNLDNLDSKGFCDAPTPTLSCDADSSYPVFFTDNFSTQKPNWVTENFSRSISNWPGNSVSNSGSETQIVQWQVANNRLEIAGAVSSQGDNEYGMVEYDLTQDNINSNTVGNYSIFAKIHADAIGLNNDIGLVFGYQNDSNYYLARWTKYGSSYSSNGSFPGTYRNLDLIKVSGGTASFLDSIANFTPTDANNFGMKVVVADQGIGVCVGNGDGSNMSLLLDSTEKPTLKRMGVFSYDNDDGIFIDDVTLRMDTPIATSEWRMDETSWSGVSGDVIDQKGNFNANAINGALTQFDSPAIAGNPGTCGYGTFDGSNDYVALPSSFENLQGSFTVTAWIRPTNLDSGSRIFIDDEKNTKGFGFSLSDGGSGRLRFYSRGVSPIIVDTGVVISANTWTFVTAVHNADTKTRQIYVNGVAQTLTGGTTTPTYTGSWGVDLGPTTIGGETDLGEVNNRFTGNIDEVRLYKQALTADQIAAIYAETHDCPEIPEEPLAFYQFEQSDFSAGVIDTSGNDRTGINLGGSSIAEGKYCRGFSSNGTNTTSVTSNAFQSGVDLDDDVGIKGTISFWFNSNTSWNSGGYNGTGERTLFDASLNVSSAADKYFQLEIIPNGRLRFAFEDSSDRDFRIDEPNGTPVRNPDTWHYLTVTWDFSADRFQLYVDGSIRFDVIRNTNGMMSHLGPIVFGDNSSTYAANNHVSLASYTSANGKFDEVKIYNFVLEQSEIIDDMNASDCTPSFSHFEIQHDGNGLTCDAEPVLIRACSDAACSAIDSSINQNVTLSINGGLSQTIPIINGTSSGATFNYTDLAVPATLSLSDTYLCKNTGTGGTGCNLTFSNAGFLFSNVNNQISAVPYAGITIQAVKDSGGVCAPLFSGSKSIDMAMEYISPNKTTTNQYIIGPKPISKNLTGLVSSYTPITLTFNNNSTAVLPSNIYLDAGQIRLHARYVQPAEPGLPSYTIIGNSNLFWVSPDKITLTAKNGTVDINGNSNTSTIKHPAGAPFTVTASAVNRFGITTTNYEPTDPELLVTRVGPTSVGVDGVLSYQGGIINSSLAPLFTDANMTFINGVYTSTTTKYSEVGLLNVDFRDYNYGNLGDPNRIIINTDAINIGRFTPAYFKQTVSETGSLTGTCGVNWAYSGEMNGSVGAINYDTVPELTITAYNNDGQITRNYRDDGTASENYLKLTNTSVTYTQPTEDVKTGKLSLPLALTATMTNAANPYTLIDGGEITYTFNPLDHFVYLHNTNSNIAPFNAHFIISIDSVIDSDNIIAANADLTDIDLNSGLAVRFGRILLENSYGPETAKLPQYLKAQYLDNTGNYIINEEDNCTPLTIANLLLPAGFSTSGPAGVMTRGEFSGLSINPPGTQQQIGVEYNAPDWLKFDWANTGNMDQNPTAIATFGRFRGNDRIIYWRETNN